MITAIILTKNEEENLKRCLPSLSFCSEILVIDDNSTDQTVKVAKSYGAKVIKHDLNGNWGATRNWAMAQAGNPWVLFVDADEVVSPELAASLQTATKSAAPGFAMKRSDIMWGKELNYGDVGNVWCVRMAKKDSGQWFGRVHETWQIANPLRIEGKLWHYPHQTMVEFLQHINLYSSLKALEFYDLGRKTSLVEIVGAPIVRFLKLYILKLGFIDGIHGFVHAILMSFYAFLVAGKLYLLERKITGYAGH